MEMITDERLEIIERLLMKFDISEKDICIIYKIRNLKELEKRESIILEQLICLLKQNKKRVEKEI